MNTVGRHLVRRLGSLVFLLLLAAAPAPAGADAAPEGERGQLVRGILMGSMQLVAERTGGTRRTGSAVVLWADAESDRILLVTAAHTLTPLVDQEVRALTPLRHDAGVATVLAVDDALDLALVEVQGLFATGTVLEPVAMAPHAMLGDDIVIASFPWGRRATLVSGMVSQIVWDETGSSAELPLGGSVALIDASVSHGMSGGGVFHKASGALVGIVRGFRTMQLTLPGEHAPAVTLPIAGETTVVPTTAILCFLGANGRTDAVTADLLAVLEQTDCSEFD